MLAKPNPNRKHSHATSEIAGLSDALESKAPVSHVHPISAVTDLQAALDSAANTIADLTLKVAQLEILAGNSGVEKIVLVEPGDYTEGDYTLPDNHKWSDFSYLIAQTHISTDALQKIASERLEAEMILKWPSAWEIYSSQNEDYVKIIATGESSFRISVDGNNSLAMLAGYKI